MGECHLGSRGTEYEGVILLNQETHGFHMTTLDCNGQLGFSGENNSEEVWEK